MLTTLAVGIVAFVLGVALSGLVKSGLKALFVKEEAKVAADLTPKAAAPAAPAPAAPAASK